MNKKTIQNSELFKEAPDSGHYLIYTGNKVEFKSYSSIAGFFSSIDDECDILEIHLFNQEKEYRAIASESAVYNKHQFVEHVAKFPDGKEDVYSETCYLENGGKITVLNHIGYGKDSDGNENGMIFVDDYRLKNTEG